VFGFWHPSPVRVHASTCSGGWLLNVRVGVVLDVSLDGEKVMSPAYMNPGDHFAISLRLPDQTVTMNVDATVRCGNRLTFRLECTAVSQLADTRTRSFLSRASSPRE
jgi:hypothetical protein